MAKNHEFEYDASRERVFTAAVGAIGALGYSVLHSDEAAASVSFNTGASMWSNAGQDMTATAVALSRGQSKLAIGGTTAQRGSQAQFGSWGERGRVAKRLAEKVSELLSNAPLQPAKAGVSATPSPSTADGLVALAELHRSGALTDDEFAKAKSQLLDG